MTSTTFKQDLPPEGGYHKINYARNPAKTYFRGGRLLAGVIIFNGCTLYYYFHNPYPRVKMEKIEKNSAHLATLPLLLAERDRAFLKHCRAIRDEEAKLMANVPNWEVGKWNGEPIYKTLDKNDFFEPRGGEFYAHASYAEFINFKYRDHLQV